MIKNKTVARKLITIKRNISQISRGYGDPELVARTTDSIEWLWRYRHISADEKDKLCDAVVEALEG